MLYFQLAQLCSNLPTSRLLLLSLFTFHTFSLASSSFVEEEHQTWFYFFNTFCVLLFISDIKCAFTTQIKPRWGRKLLTWMSFLLSHIFARRLNQTGDKWINLPDISDYLVKEENKVLMSFFVIFALVTIFYSLHDDESWSKYTSLSCILCLASIYSFRAATGFVLPSLNTSHSSTCLVFFWIGLGLILCLSVGTTSTKVSTLIILTVLTSALIHKPHNIVLNGLCVVTCNFVTDKIKTTMNIANRKYNYCLVTIAVHYCIGKVFYFYQVSPITCFLNSKCDTIMFFRGTPIAWRLST